MERGEEPLTQIRRQVEGQLGRNVRIYSRRGRSKPQIRQGVVEQTYPNVFTVMVGPGALRGDEDGALSAIRPAPPERLSFSYSDLLTRQVRLSELEE